MRINVEISELTKRGYTYNVKFNGETIVTDSYDPEFDACRVLVSRDIKGKVTTYKGDKACMVLSIEKAANHRVGASNEGTPIIRKKTMSRSGLETNKIAPGKFGKAA